MDKLVSIIVPIYNIEKYLNKCIGSIVNQTYKNLEIILIDDDSPDNCPAVCDEWAKKDSRIKVMHKENDGLSQARNSGYQMSTGEYICFIDGDDWIESDFIETLASQLDKGADIADCATRLCDEKDVTILIRGFNENKVIDNTTALQFLFKETGIYQTVWNKLYKRNIIDSVKFPAGKWHEDDFWTWKVFLNAKSISVTSKPMYNYLQRENSIMGDSYSLKRLDAVQSAYECFEALNDNAQYSSLVKNRFISRVMYNLQCSFKYLNGSDLKSAKKVIFKYLKDANLHPDDNNLTSVWYRLFLLMPSGIARIRNFLKIGF